MKIPLIMKVLCYLQIIIYLHKTESCDNFTENYLSHLRFKNSCKASKYFKSNNHHLRLKMPNKKAIFCNFCDRIFILNCAF